MEKVIRDKQEPQFEIDELAAWTKKWRVRGTDEQCTAAEQILANLRTDFKSYNR